MAVSIMSKFQREVVAAVYKKVEYEQETDDFFETNLWEITESQRNTVDNIFSRTRKIEFFAIL